MSVRSRRCHGRTGPLAAGRALAARFAARSAARGESEGQEAWGTGAPATCAARTDLSLVHPIRRPLARGAGRETAAAPVLTAVAPLAIREMCSEPAGTDRRIGASGLAAAACSSASCWVSARRRAARPFPCRRHDAHSAPMLRNARGWTARARGGGESWGWLRGGYGAVLSGWG